MLDRIGDEVARATSIVRYAPGSRFSKHGHELGEEFLVLDGVFSDESGDYPTGSYVRNPPGSSHAPHSDDGCVIFVKLRQFDRADLLQFSIDTEAEACWQDNVLPLHSFGRERVRMLRLATGQSLAVGDEPGGIELLVVAGTLTLDGERYPRRSWLRFPDGDAVTVSADTASVLWLKSGHLPPAA